MTKTLFFHIFFRVVIYGAMALIITYFFLQIVDANKKITYVDLAAINPNTLTHIIILEDGTLMADTTNESRIVGVGNAQAFVRTHNLSYSTENRFREIIIRYLLGIAFVICIFLATLT